ncbi:MAG: hypothetical protein PHG00_18040 [Methylococcales bacterium]|nr:hypothetical protein [Methylococcales bacterium]
MNVESGGLLIGGEINHEKFDRYSQVLKLSGISHPIRIGLPALPLPLILSSCATEAQFIAQSAPWALNTALARGLFELNCPQANGAVLSQKVTYINGLA